MNIDRLTSEARQRVSGHTPSYINLSEATLIAKPDIADMVIERIQVAMEQAILGAQSVLRSESQKYIEGLYIKDDLTIGIRENVSYLEEGYDRREMLNDLLDSPKANITKDGDRYITIPIGKKQDSNISQAIRTKTSELFSKGKQSSASGKTLENMVSDMHNLLRKSRNASVSSRGASEEQFRTASDSQDSGTNWVHPGFQGVNQLEFINQQLKVDLLDGAVRILETVVDRLRR